MTIAAGSSCICLLVLNCVELQAQRAAGYLYVSGKECQRIFPDWSTETLASGVRMLRPANQQTRSCQICSNLRMLNKREREIGKRYWAISSTNNVDISFHKHRSGPSKVGWIEAANGALFSSCVRVAIYIAREAASNRVCC